MSIVPPSELNTGESSPNTPQPSSKLVFILVFVLLVVTTYVLLNSEKTNFSLTPGTIFNTANTYKKFASEAEYKTYLEKSQELNDMQGGGIATFGMREDSLRRAMPPSAGMAQPTMEKTADGGPIRVSETNTQVKGIDEPDIVKTDGRSLFVSSDTPYYLMEKPLPAIRMAPGVAVAPDSFPQLPPGETRVITAFPPEKLAKLTGIKYTGDLLLIDKTLVIFSGKAIYGYDVADPAQPIEKWKTELDEKNELVTSRLLTNKIYIVTRQSIDFGHPCPIPLMEGSAKVIPCVEIYRPETVVSVDVTYTGLILNPFTGEIEKTVSFVGKYDSSVIYMSPNALYVTYSFTGDMFDVLYGFYKNEGRSLISDTVVQKLSQLNSYELSMSTKLQELQTVVEHYYQSLSKDEQLRLQNETQNKLESYMKTKARELEKTGIVKVRLADFSVTATAEISGRPLNQFSLDEYQDTVRIATTFGDNWWGFGGSNTQNASDVYILNEDLKTMGVVKDLGAGERIYSVRFVENQGYVVTFRQTDPFYVLDLSNPRNPQKTGELKIPGFSSYLHPLAKNIILGVGQENGKVKLSLFNVTDPVNPTEVAKYSLDEYWTEVSNNYHAFLQDGKHQIFFLPAGQGGYIFSYSDHELTLQKTVSEDQIKRAVFINDYLYLVGEQNITVLDENNWETIKTLNL